MKKASEDLSLRPFASAHFDSQGYVRSVLSERRSEEVLSEVDRHIQGINEEINKYISHRRRDLVGGMQDVSVLAAQYKAMHQTSENLRRLSTKLKQEATESFDGVQTKTAELERMHDTAVVLRQLRQFVHTKGQLDHHLKRGGDGEIEKEEKEEKEYDIRHLAAAARILRELETLSELPALCRISAVVSCRADIDQFGKYIRLSSKKILLSALRDQNQANISSALQVFFHLESLPEVILFAIDNTAKLVADLVKEVIDIGALVNSHPELGGIKANTTRSTARPAAAGKKDAHSHSNLRLALREISQQFENIIYEYSMHLSIVQRLVAQREIPSAPALFMEALMVNKHDSNPFFKHNGSILDVFWDRLAVSLHDVFHDKLKQHSTALVRLYPSLRKAAVDVVDSFKAMAARESALAVGPQTSDAALLAIPGSDIFGCRFMSISPTTLGFGVSRMSSLESRAGASSAARDAADARLKSTKAEDERDVGLVAGLDMCRDRFLVEALGRMSAPIGLMFPDVEGFVSAVPSKRDLEALLGAIKTDVAAVIMEGEVTLLKLVTKEVVKVVKLLLSKLESLINSSPDVAKIAIANGASTRNSAQEHNNHILSLVQSLCDSMRVISVEILKQAQDAMGSKIARSVGANEAFKLECLEVLKSHVANASISLLEAFVSQTLLLGTITAMSNYANEIIVLLISGENSTTALTVPDSHKHLAEGVDPKQCSRVVRYIDWAVPLLIKSHLNLTEGTLKDAVHEEMCYRVIASLISAYSVARPMNSELRSKALNDISLLESRVCAICPHLKASIIGTQSPTINPVFRELQCFKALLSKGDFAPPINSAANIAFLKSEEMTVAMRPSTLIGYLMSIAPSQLPSVVEVEGNSPSAYLRSLSDPPTTDVSKSMITKSIFANESVSCLYFRDFEAVPSQAQVWSLALQCLDVLMQRSVVAEGPQKESLRLWYEAIVEVGGHVLSRDRKSIKV